MLKLTMIGTGYVGLTTGVAAAYLGHDVWCVDKDPVKLGLLQKGLSPIHERGMDELLLQVQDRISFSGQVEEAVQDANVIMIAVGTPPKINGQAETRYVEEAAREVAEGLVGERTYVVVVKSTVPIGSNRRVAHVVSRVLAARGVNADVCFASNPEFLREGRALEDTFYPDRIVVGADHPVAFATLHEFYLPILDQSFAALDFIPKPKGKRLPVYIKTDPTSAEMTKYAANAFLATKISFANEIAGLCEKVGADIIDVAYGMGLDSRIGTQFLGAGLGWGGSCFPKDTSALLAVGAEYGYSMPIVHAAREVNLRQRHVAIEKLQGALKVLRGRTIGILGLSFKPNTDDVRESPAIDIIRLLADLGAHVRAYDPVALKNARRVLQDLDIDFVDSPYTLASGCDGLVLATEWDSFRDLNLERLAASMQVPVLVDGRNFFDPDQARQAGFVYMGMGRSGPNFEGTSQDGMSPVIRA